ncbi:MAG: hypothetical protein ABSC42_11580 [Tepidisphaeraceae bacterium]|jgi:hypothetical protein
MLHLFHRADPGATTTGDGIAAPENVKPGNYSGLPDAVHSNRAARKLI